MKDLFDITTLKENPENPYKFTGTETEWEDFKYKINRDLDFLKLRPIVYDSGNDNIILGGNKRYLALIELGITKVNKECVRDAAQMTDEEKRRFIFADNYNLGTWEMEFVTDEEAEEWSIDVSDNDNNNIDTIGDDLDVNLLGTDFSLPSGDKSPFQQVTFTFADEQAIIVKNAISDIKGTEEYKYVETMGNENSNGNALYLIVMQWGEQRK